MTNLRNAVLAIAALGVLAGSTAHASDIAITLDTSVFSAAPGDTITVSGYLTNLDNAQVDLIGCTPTLLGLFTVDCSPFFANAPFFLNPLEVTSSFDMFTVTVQSPFTDPFARYSGIFTVDGGIDNGGSSDDVVIGQTAFSVDVVPEPGTAGLLGMVAAVGIAYAGLRRRNR
jgi:hypothetical protein